MNEQQIIEAYPKICGWLKIETYQGKEGLYRVNRTIYPNLGIRSKRLKKINFLHSADQREWIENRLIELGYVIATVSDIEGTNVTIYKRDEEPVNAETTSAKSKPIAFLQAVMELIEKNAPKLE